MVNDLRECNQIVVFLFQSVHFIHPGQAIAHTTLEQTLKCILYRCMDQDLSWDHAAQLYEEVLVEAKYQW
jgi:hypothetical protein